MKCEELWPKMTLGEEIGFGAYGTVYRAHLAGEEYALKKICIPGDAKGDASWKQLPRDDPDRREWARKRTEELLEEVRIQQLFKSIHAAV